MDSQMQRHPFPFEYILEGDVEAMSKQDFHTYFTEKEVEKGVRMNMSNVTSCALKHLLAYERIIAENRPGALILEDDVILSKDFDNVFQQTLAEYREMYTAQPVIISYEDTRLRFVPRSKRQKGRFLYPGDRDRMAAAYFINRNAAQVILHEAKTTKCHLPIDLYHRHLLGLGKLCYLWCQPTIASQGSFTGLFPSTLSEKTQFMERIIWMCKLAYKKILYNLR